MIIWGSKGRTKTVGTGEFYCPRCQQRRPYELKEVGKYFTLYFIPIVKTRDLGEYVECQICKTPFNPEVVQASRRLEEDQAARARIADFISAAKDTLHSGVPIDGLITQLQRSGLDKEAAIKLVVLVTGNSLSQCPRCKLVYVETLSFCSNCGASLNPLSV